MSSTFGVLSAFIAERDVFERERSVGMYSTLAYFLSKVRAALPAFSHLVTQRLSCRELSTTEN